MRRLSIVESTNTVKARILFEAAEVVDNILRRNSPVISRKISTLLANRIHETPHMKSILGGKLKADFGLTDEMADEALGKITELIRSNTIIKLYKRPQKDLFYSLEIRLLPNGVTPFLSIRYDSDGGPVDWMDWLLTKGVTIINEDFFVAYGSFSSRTGEAIMMPAGSSGKDFRVDPEFAGTEDDNFIVNVVKQSYPDMVAIVGSYL